MTCSAQQALPLSGSIPTVAALVDLKGVGGDTLIENKFVFKSCSVLQGGMSKLHCWQEVINDRGLLLAASNVYILPRF